MRSTPLLRPSSCLLSAALAVGLWGCTVQYAPPAMYYVPPDALSGDAAPSDAAAADLGGAEAGTADAGNQELPASDAIKADTAPADVASGQTCADRCTKPFTSTKPCQCTWDCAKYGTCCPDWVAVCHPQDNLDWYSPPAGACSQPGDWVKVKSNPDGDTIHLQELDSTGYHLAVRFLLVDTAETTTAECMSAEAKKATWDSLVKSSLSVCLVAEPGGEDKDMYGRLLRYVYVKDPALAKPIQLNLRLLRLGLGRVLYPFAAGNSLEKLALETMAQAKVDNLGGWGKCGWVQPK